MLVLEQKEGSLSSMDPPKSQGLSLIGLPASMSILGPIRIAQGGGPQHSMAKLEEDGVSPSYSLGMVCFTLRYNILMEKPGRSGTMERREDPGRERWDERNPVYSFLETCLLPLPPFWKLMPS